jgi:type IV pilus assembly protein PilW
MSRRLAPTRPAQRGCSLIELMVSVAIGLIVTLAITGVLVASEGRKRSATAVNDVNQTGAYLSYVLDKAIRSAGSGFTDRAQQAVGCALTAAVNSATILPSAALPAPFAAFSAANPTLRLAPVVIGQGQSDTGSDVLMVMAGNGGFAEVAQKVGAGTGGSNLAVPNTLTMQAQDLFLLANSGVSCLVTEAVATPAAGSAQVQLGGRYFAEAVNGVTVSSFGGGGGLAIPLGNAANRPPLFQLFGVGNNSTLFSYDLLQTGGAAPIPVADGVVALHARYGVDTNGDRVLDAWVGATGAFSAANLLNGSATAQTNLRSILAVRIGLVLRTPLQEREAAAPAKLVLFQDLGALAQDFTPGAANANFRFRTVEATVPMRNTLL